MVYTVIMHLGSWQQRILIALGLLLVVVPIIGLPILVKNILVVVAGFLLVTLILITSDNGQAKQIKTDDLIDVAEKKEEVALPSVYHEQVPEFYTKNDLVLSPIKPKVVRRRVSKNTKLKPIEDHASVV